MENALNSVEAADQPLVDAELPGVHGNDTVPKEVGLPTGVDLPDGQVLGPAGALEVTRAAPTRLIVLAGEVDSGKTTILSALYDRFQRGPFAGYLFAGSRTLIAFEQRCHMARVTSLRSTPATKRTELGTRDQLLHLRVRQAAMTNAPQDLLFTDLSGEAFRDAKNSPEGCRSLPMLLRADHFVLLVDGRQLLDPGTRQVALADARAILRSCLDAEMLSSRTLVDILFTKKDLLLGDGASQQKAMKFIDEIAKPEFRRHFADRVGRLRMFDVAARPEDNSLELAYGLDSVLPSWVQDSRANTETELSAASPTSGREFDRFLVNLPLGGD